MNTLLLILLTFSSIITCDSISNSPQNKPYDHMQLVETWPVTFCSNNPCQFNPLPSYFTLHGLWPVDKKGQGIKCDLSHEDWCSELTDESNKTAKALLYKMLRYWPNLKWNLNDGEDKQCILCNWEWNKHGVCGSDEGFDYFAKAIKLRTSLDIYEALRDKGFEPGKSYPLGDLKDAIKEKHMQHDVAIKCTKIKGNFMISEVVLCFERQGETPIHCNAKEIRTSDNSCGNGAVQINYPSTVQPNIAPSPSIPPDVMMALNSFNNSVGSE